LLKKDLDFKEMPFTFHSSKDPEKKNIDVEDCLQTDFAPVLVSYAA